jgi:hypothetical protein
LKITFTPAAVNVGVYTIKLKYTYNGDTSKTISDYFILNVVPTVPFGNIAVPECA